MATVAEMKIQLQNYRTQIIKDDIENLRARRRNGELSVGIQDFMEGKIDRDALATIQANNTASGPDTFNLIAAIVDLAVDLANGNEGAMEAITEVATELRDYDANKIKPVRAATVSEDGEAPTRIRKARITPEEANEALVMVSEKIGSKAVSVKEFNENHPTLTAPDVIAAHGKWSLAQQAAGLTVTKRGRKPKAA